MTQGKRILALVTDAYGGRGGIAAYARDSIAAMSADPRVEEIVVLPRIVGTKEEKIPPKVRFERRAGGGTMSFISQLGRTLWSNRFDAVWVNHIHLSPIALAAARLSGVRLGLVLHGIEAWTPSRRRSVRFAAQRADLLLPVSNITLGRFRRTHRADRIPWIIAPGSVDLARFTPGPKPLELARRFGVTGRRVITTLGRLDSSEQDAKGFGRVIAAMPQLTARWPDLVYLIGGTGKARPFLERLIAQHGVADHVRFAGEIPEADKRDFYRLSDAYVMPSLKEGLGIVFLEAQACAVPAIASNVDGGQEAVAGMGWTVDPHSPAQLQKALEEAFSVPRERPAGIGHFAVPAMTKRVEEALSVLLC